MPFSEIIAGKLEQFAASLASIFAVLGIAGALLLGAWLIAKWLGRVGRPDLRAYDASPWGDYPAIPTEAKAAASERFVAGGRSKAEAGRRDIQQDTSLRTGTEAS